MVIEILLASVGSSLALSGIGLELVYLISPKSRSLLDWAGNLVQFKKTDDPIKNLRQGLLSIACAFLLAFVIIQRQPVYISLQSYVTFTSFAWYFSYGSDPKTAKNFENVKSVFCFSLSCLIWVGLEYLGLCPGFHRIATLGLLFVAFGYVLTNPLARNFLCVLGTVLLAAYGIVGLMYDNRGFGTYLNGFIVNVMFAIISTAILVVSYKSKGKN